MKERPSNDEFKIHFERSLDPPGIEDPDVSAGRAPYIPLLDDPFTSAEITDAIQTGKVTRSGGPSGIPPGLLKALPAYAKGHLRAASYSRCTPTSLSASKMATLVVCTACC